MSVNGRGSRIKFKIAFRVILHQTLKYQTNGFQK